MWCQQSLDVLQNDTLAALVCSADPSDTSLCVAICPNADISGVGVRTAFYLQSIMNTLLVIFSRRDSVPSAWASTLFTASLVIAAMVQKSNQTITLHHATLTLNFATLSCISSLAVAPTLSIWRLTPEGYYTQQLARHVLGISPELGDNGVITPKDKTRIQRAQGRQRLFLALALLTQVVLQWAWGVVLFVSPIYSQTNCSGDTILIFFLAPFTARQINDHFMVVWVFWLLFSLGITLVMTIVLALTSPSRARPLSTSSSSRSSSLVTHSSSESARRPIYVQFFDSLWKAIPPWRDTARQRIFWYNVASTVFWLIYIIGARYSSLSATSLTDPPAASEIQIQANCIFAGENTISSFGQITALLLSMQPLWSLIVAFPKWLKRHRHMERRRKRQLQEHAEGFPSVSVDLATEKATVQETEDVSNIVTRGRSSLVAVDRVAPALVVAPRSDYIPPVPTTSTPSLRPRGTALPGLHDVYIPRTEAEEWDALVSFTHLPRAFDRL
ncbi:hypothetical protein BD413DRAFT_280050 [Trametes elegans]|nr:hypothetical protein BD413DRAFT_280050 [Trametes elegans]